jgi:very-short-patch-repair endonuclease
MTGDAEPLDRGLLAALCRTYADLLRRQRTAATPFARWGHTTQRSHEFLWLGGTVDRDQLMLVDGGKVAFSRDEPLFDAIHKMYGTARLNPYERELLYGYPYVVGRLGDRAIRGPLLTLAVEIEAADNRLVVHAADDVLRFNSLPFRADSDTAAHDQALERVMEQTPSLPLTVRALNAFVAVLSREVPDLALEARLDGTLAAPPAEPRSREGLRLIDQAALFVAPKTNYFLRSDLDAIATAEGDDDGAIQPIIEGAGDEDQVDITNEQVDRARIFYPFPSNRAQRKVALLVDDPTTQVIRVEGPPGTGKSLTIANLACHFAASGKRVLVTSQKDKALEVVDAKLRELNLAELPMTLLRQDRESKTELLSRLDRVEKRRGKEEVESHFTTLSDRLEETATEQIDDAAAYARAIRAEDAVEEADRAHRAATRLRRFSTSWHARSVIRRAARHAHDTTDEVAERMTERRQELLDLSLSVLQVGLERGVSGASRSGRQVVRQLQDTLKKDQKSFKNFSMFDRLKTQHDHAEKLLGILPVWIMSPDDVARLFPCTPGLFDLVIVDEASQVDLPSILPIAYRAKKVAVFGDTKQMQSQRFAFMSRNVALEAWQQYGMDRFDPDARLHPVQQSLLGLANLRAQEELVLDEHFRSLPPIIDFSNERWYSGRLRIMTDAHQKQFGRPDQPIIQLHPVRDGVISNGSQENEVEARALVDLLAEMVEDPDYAGASIGVLCLFEEQVALVDEMVSDAIDPAEWEEHALVVVNPDGFQGDERDVILYSLSWDNNVMPQAALSARQMDTPHIQGMLNVAFTRARDEIHVFHSAPIDTYGMAGSRTGALGEWMAHCAEVQAEGGQRRSGRHGRVDSEFEADVADALRARDVTVMHQYPACGFSIDMMCELDGARLGVECDGELYHDDEHGNLRVEDIERQAILERAGHRILRIPYRKWLRDPGGQVERVLAALEEPNEGDDADDDDLGPTPAGARETAKRVSRQQRAIIEGIRSGLHGEEDVLRFARDELSYKRLGPRIRSNLLAAAVGLNHLGLVVIEDGEYFLTPLGRTAELRVLADPASRTSSRRRPPRRRYRRF